MLAPLVFGAGDYKAVRRPGFFLEHFKSLYKLDVFFSGAAYAGRIDYVRPFYRERLYVDHSLVVMRPLVEKVVVDSVADDLNFFSVKAKAQQVVFYEICGNDYRLNPLKAFQCKPVGKLGLCQNHAEGIVQNRHSGNRKAAGQKARGGRIQDGANLVFFVKAFRGKIMPPSFCVHRFSAADFAEWNFVGICVPVKRRAEKHVFHAVLGGKVGRQVDQIRAEAAFSAVAGECVHSNFHKENIT